MESAGAAERRVILVLADISGYTGFFAEHRKALAHSQMIVTDLLQTIIAAVPSLQVSKLEGDAVFLHAPRDADPARIGRELLGLFERFSDKLGDLVRTSICTCPACGGIHKLRLKVLAHCGDALFYRIGVFDELAGMDVILVHRLLKNAVAGNEYLLMTDAARAELLPDVRVDASHEEDITGFDPTRVHVHFPAIDHDARLGQMQPEGFAGSHLAVEILRCEVRREYAEVATHPDKGYHFHTGRKLAALLGYREEWLEGIPARAVESLAGTGNPLSMGLPAPGEHVVDVGCGAGLDSLLAGRAVGATGQVIGIDMTAEMLALARSAAAEAGMDHVQFHNGHAEALPVADGWADLVISNGALNLCPDKASVLAEMCRVLHPGGRLQVGDILVQKPIPDKAKRQLDLWTG